jgi:hypothetical protein
VAQSKASHPPHRLPGRQLRQKFARRFLKFGMARLRGNLDQRFENEFSLMHSGMRNLQARFIHHAIPEQHYIYINVAWAMLAHAETSHRRFNLQCQLKQFSWRLVRFNRRYTIQKPGLIWKVDRLRLIQCGDGQQPSARVQLRKRRTKVGRTVSQIRSQR